MAAAFERLYPGAVNERAGAANRLLDRIRAHRYLHMLLESEFTWHTYLVSG